MTDYTITTNFGAKDSLPSGNAAKVIKGSEFTTEFTNIATAVNSKADTAGDTFTGVVNFSNNIAVDTDTLFVDASTNRVGIGTDSPTTALEVTGGLIVDTDTLYVDDTNDRVGIGTASPQQPLHVMGNATFDGGTSTVVDVLCDNGGTAELKAYGAGQSNGRVYVGQDDTHGGGIEYSGAQDPALSGAGNDQIALYRRTDSTNHWTARNFHDNNDWEFRGSLIIPSAIIHANDTDTYTQFHSTNQWRVVTGGAERLEVNNSAVTTSTKFVGEGSIQYSDFTVYSNTDGDQQINYTLPSGAQVINAVVTTPNFDTEGIRQIRNNGCVLNRVDAMGNQNINLRVWHTQI